MGSCTVCISLQWRHNGRDAVSNHQSHDCLFNRLFRHRSKKTSKFRVTGPCVGNYPVTSEFLEQKASNAKNVSIWWRHHRLWLCRVSRRMVGDKQEHIDGWFRDIFPFCLACLTMKTRMLMWWLCFCIWWNESSRDGIPKCSSFCTKTCNVKIITDIPSLRRWLIAMPFISPFIAASGHHFNRFPRPRNPFDSVLHISFSRRVPVLDSLNHLMSQEKYHYVIVPDNHADSLGFLYMLWFIIYCCTNIIQGYFNHAIKWLILND